MPPPDVITAPTALRDPDTAARIATDADSDPTAPPAIAISGLRVCYGEFQAVRGIDLEVRRGEVFALLGTNGAGKTTTLEVLEGFRARSAGTVSVLGVDPARDAGALRRRTGIMFQESGYFDELTADETLNLWSNLVERQDQPQRLLERFGLDHRRDVSVGKLSGGERRRLELALTFYGSPELVILDEPTTGLDPEARRSAWEAIADFARAGHTVLLTTHYLEEAEALADHLAIMDAGQIAVRGTLAEIVSRQPARVTARVPVDRIGEIATAGPVLDGQISADGSGQIQVVTGALQEDLTRLLAWAADRDLALHELRASPAALSEVYHEIVTADQSEENS